MGRVTMMLPTSRAWVEAAEAARRSPGAPIPGNVDDAERAKEGLLQDYDRLSRLGVGLLATLMCCVGGLFAGACVEVVRTEEMDGLQIALAGALFIGSVALAVYGARILVRLHLSSRRLLLALGFWAAVPFHLGERGPLSRGWLNGRVVMGKTGVLLRLVCCGFATGLALLFWLFLFAGDLPVGIALVMVVWALVMTCVAGCLMSASFRITNAYAELHLLWATVRAKFDSPARTR
ncbi:hypothetical protein NQ156_02630 [Microbacterium sp. zg.Y625]|uniref:hypothetical protein n=1 Tax=Microbacterium jiangjiandongii TaxID=3049071 RepID=UPI00214B23EC|nr:MULTISPECIES: hypothetical protein [unclassified Microbacterium]MCR2791953.1 hypothetical protein [Microbacterium sp. zg.Y625]WIM24764.1 hypothetical protein QNO14_11540 [Microbacterium sp. zg-Y625]